ncbi:MAG: hypothetical protein JNM27_00855 [Leptospirales bacterium]|nr:hypothetical protein [Leptospirales bacterium]
MHPRQPFYASVSYALPGLSPLASLLDSSFYCEGRWIVNNQTASATREMPQHTGPNSDSSSRLPAPLDSRLSVSCRDSHISSQAQTAGQGAGTTFPGTSPFRQIRHPDAALLPPVRHCLS